ncbi:TraX family protein [Pseudomonas huanghezhanensis]|uniref:TraX family protein n=1 Tax=Pseudomonas huanghezhanensis TaxID=3002903 RepID=UPI0022865A00|nr:TraX family protein [Pseudomonas sp. BSw22131]
MTDSNLPMAGARDKALDLLKWLAMLSMVMDHLRYVGWYADWLYVPGRVAFPWFCLAIAVNLARSRTNAIQPRVQWKYLTWLVVFAVVAEVPYRLFMTDEAYTLNVLPTLALGLLVAQGWVGRSFPVRMTGGFALLAGVLFSEHLMFGFFGVLLPLAFLLVLQRSIWLAIVPGAVCLFSNAWRQILDGAQWGDPVSVGALIACLLAPVLGMLLLRAQPPFAVLPMRRWAYAIYPAHFLLLLGLREILVALPFDA